LLENKWRKNMRSYKNFVYPRKKRKANGEKMQKKEKKK